MKKLFLIFLFIACQLLGATQSEHQDRFTQAKKQYLQAIMTSDTKKEIESLKDLIIYGEKLNENTWKYKKELNKLGGSITEPKKVTTQTVLKPKQPPKQPPKQAPSIVQQPLQTTIKTVTQNENSISLEFNRRVNKSFIDYSKFKDGDDFYDQFDIKGYFKDAYPTKLAMNGVDRIIITQHTNDTLRIRFKNRSNLKIIYIINKSSIIIKVLNLKTQKTGQVPTIPDGDIFYPSRKTIVIDPGHGGKDPGAVNGKLYEKDVVLDVSKYLKEELEKNGFKVYLTRSSDKYLKLSTRTQYANRKNADLFISIHANAVAKSNAHKVYGIETYF